MVQFARDLVDSPSWRLLADFDPRAGLVALHGNLVAGKSLGRATVSPASWENLFFTRGYMVFEALYSLLSRRCPSSVELENTSATLVSTDLRDSMGIEMGRFNWLAREYALLAQSSAAPTARWSAGTNYNGVPRLLGTIGNREGGDRSFQVVVLRYDSSGYLDWYGYASTLPDVVPAGADAYFTVAIPPGTDPTRIALRTVATHPALPSLTLRVVDLQARTVVSVPGSRLLNITGMVENPTATDARPATVGFVLLDSAGNPVEVSDDAPGFLHIPLVPARSSVPFSIEFKTSWVNDPTVYRAFARAPPPGG